MCKASRSAMALGLLLAGCATPERCVRWYPPAVLTRERVVTDTLVVSRAAALDTSLRWSQPTQDVGTDTLLLRAPRVQVRLVRVADTVRIAARCAPDTVRVPVVRELIRLAPPPILPPPLQWWQRPQWGWLLAAGLALLLLRRIV